MKKKRVAIIGAGPCGLSLMHAFKTAQEKRKKEKDDNNNADDDIIPEIVCFEKQDNWGGLWNYSWYTGVDKYGNQCHNGMYRYLFSNGPKECLEFADYTFEEHFGKPIASYPSRPVLFDYIQGRAEKSGFREWIRFSTIVRDVRAVKDGIEGGGGVGGGGFEVTARNEVTDTETREYFDYVVVATGHFSVPNMPEFPGFDTFFGNGRILHAHDFRDAREFTGKDVLIIGTSYSGEDIAAQCWKYGAKSVTISHRTQPTGFHWPQNIPFEELPLLHHVEGKTAYFVDDVGKGSDKNDSNDNDSNTKMKSKDVDVIILCTGYKHHFPFLSDELRLKTTNRLATSDLYKGVVWNKNPNLFYLGMQDQWYTFSMFDVQAWWVRDCIMGKIHLPEDKDVMIQDPIDRQKAEDALPDDYARIAYQGAYTAELLNETDYPKFDIETTNKIFYEWKKQKKIDIITYRDNGYVSPMTGTVAPTHHTPWKDAFDDSMESYLA